MIRKKVFWYLKMHDVIAVSEVEDTVHVIAVLEHEDVVHVIAVSELEDVIHMIAGLEHEDIVQCTMQHTNPAYIVQTASLTYRTFARKKC